MTCYTYDRCLFIGSFYLTYLEKKILYLQENLTSRLSTNISKFVLVKIVKHCIL